jgi:DNA-binding transcriptional ArsR family regulator
MNDGPVISRVAALMGEPARANMLTALMDGRALTASELAAVAGVALPTASGHLAQLADARLIEPEKQGRHRYFRLSGPDVAAVIEGLMGLAQRTGAVRRRTGPKDDALRAARLCYDHLAGEHGVALYEALVRNAWIVPGKAAPTLIGREGFLGFGIDMAALETKRRPLCRGCLDWSERRAHLGGAVGAALLIELERRRWLKRERDRVVTITTEGARQLPRAFEAA